MYINTDKYREIGSFKLDKDKLVTIISEIDEPGISRLAYYNPQFVMGTTYLIYIGLTMILLVLLLVNVILLIVLKSKRKVDLDVVLD